MVIIGTTGTEKKYYLEVNNEFVIQIEVTHSLSLSLLVGSEFKDDVIDIMSYFSGSVYNGFGDDINVRLLSNSSHCM